MERVFNENLYSKKGYFDKLSTFELGFLNLKIERVRFISKMS